LDPRTRRLLEAPIVPTLLRLGAPNVLIMLAQASVGLIETFFVGKLGTDALAGMALVFPAVMLMQTISAGAFGGAIASVIARALGAAGQRPAPNPRNRMTSPLVRSISIRFSVPRACPRRLSGGDDNSGLTEAVLPDRVRRPRATNR
jgi:hypothetical protein